MKLNQTHEPTSLHKNIIIEFFVNRWTIKSKSVILRSIEEMEKVAKELYRVLKKKGSGAFFIINSIR